MDSRGRETDCGFLCARKKRMRFLVCKGKEGVLPRYCAVGLKNRESAVLPRNLNHPKSSKGR